jgi:hypothetical protein
LIEDLQVDPLLARRFMASPEMPAVRDYLPIVQEIKLDLVEGKMLCRKEWTNWKSGSPKNGRVVWIRVARWFLFEPKIPIWANFGGP